MTETRLLIGGEQVTGAGDPLEVENPYSEETIASVALPSTEQVDAAIASAREAAKGWAQTPAIERGELLHDVATRLRSRADELAELMTKEGGKPLIENSDEVGWTAAAFGLGGDVGIDWIKQHTVNDESIRDEGRTGYINPLHSFLPSSLRGPQLYLPGVHSDGSVDFEW